MHCLPTASTKPIEAVKQGDLVATRDPATEQVEGKRVIATSQSHTNLVLAITLCDGLTGEAVETVEATRQHPFFVEGKGFVPAGGLAVGNAIVTRAGPPLLVSKIEWKRSADGYTVYNFLVEGDHTYFVGSANGGLWVHNGGPTCPIQPTMERDMGLPEKDVPTEAYDREKHYGHTPTTAQSNSVPLGKSFDHDPPLVKHYYEGDGKGGIPGFKMTQQEREMYAKSIRSGRAATQAEQDAQGGQMAHYAIRMKRFYNLK